MRSMKLHLALSRLLLAVTVMHLINMKENIMKKSRLINLIFSLLLICSAAIYSEDVYEIKFSNWVVDNPKILKESELNELNRILKQIQDETTNQIFVAIINSLDGKLIEDFTHELYNTVGIGEKTKNNGALILLAMKEGGVRITLGYGLENIFTDSYAGYIIDNHMVPHFKNGDFKSGIFEAVKVIKEKLYEPDIKHYFTMKWDIKNFEKFITKYPNSIQKCDAFMFLGRFYEDKWNDSMIKMLNNEYREKSINYYDKYLSNCEKGIWKTKVEYELKQIENKNPDSIKYLME